MQKSIKQYILKNTPIDISHLRESQIEHKYLIPSDYVYILIKYGKLEFKEIMSVEIKESKLDFDEFYDIELIEWQLKHTRKERKILKHDFWIDSYLCIGQMTSKHILIGTQQNNLNQIFVFDNEEANIDFVSNHIFEFIEKRFSPFKPK